MFYRLCISVYACNKTKLFYLSSVNSDTIPLHVSGLLVAHHQEVTKYKSADSRLRRTTRTDFSIYTLLPPDDRLLASLKHVEVQ
jgi:hypothetical protein